MPHFMTIHAFKSVDALGNAAGPIVAALAERDDVSRRISYGFDREDGGISVFSCFEAASDAALGRFLKDQAGPPPAIILPIHIAIPETAEPHGGPGIILDVRRGKVCQPEQLETVGRRVEAAHQRILGELNVIEHWLYEEDGGVGATSIYQAKTGDANEETLRSAIEDHAADAGIAALEVLKIRVL